MTRRSVLLSVAIAAAVIGLAVAFFPDVVPATSLPGVLQTVIAAGAVLLGLARAYRWLRRDATQTEPPVRERSRPFAVPGDDFDALLGRTPRAGTSSGNRQAVKVRRDLESAAVDALVVYRGLSESEARAHLQEGTWTDDPLAAEFFTHIHGTGSSVAESVAGAFRIQGPFHKRARRAAAAIDAIVDSGGGH